MSWSSARSNEGGGEDVDGVVGVVQRGGLAPPVARLRPIGVVKG